MTESHDLPAPSGSREAPPANQGCNHSTVLKSGRRVRCAICGASMTLAAWEKSWNIPEPVAAPVATEREERLQAALIAARDVLAAFQKEVGYRPAQGGYSTTMTDGEIKVARAVADLSGIISEFGAPVATEAPKE